MNPHPQAVIAAASIQEVISTQKKSVIGCSSSVQMQDGFKHVASVQNESIEI